MFARGYVYDGLPTHVCAYVRARSARRLAHIRHMGRPCSNYGPLALEEVARQVSNLRPLACRTHGPQRRAHERFARRRAGREC